MVLADRTIARLLAESRIEIDPYDEELLQPSSVDVRVDRYFRVFHNNRYPFIDVREEQDDLTELVEVDDETPFVLHPGEFVLGSTLERVRLPDDLVARLEGKSSLGRLGLLIHSTAGVHRPRLGRPRHARAVERREPAGDDLPGDEDRTDLVRAAHRARADAVRQRRDRLEIPGPARADTLAVLAEFPHQGAEGLTVFRRCVRMLRRNTSRAAAEGRSA
jgi:2'-deoxycytidine 5'-triphosphate deaminase (DCD)